MPIRSDLESRAHLARAAHRGRSSPDPVHPPPELPAEAGPGRRTDDDVASVAAKRGAASPCEGLGIETPEAARARETAAFARLLPLDDVAGLRPSAVESGWPRHCPDPRCARGGCRGRMRGLAPGLARTRPSCLAFALRAVFLPDELGVNDTDRARDMMPTLFKTEAELEEARARGWPDDGPLVTHEAPLPAELHVIAVVLAATPGRLSDILLKRD